MQLPPGTPTLHSYTARKIKQLEAVQSRTARFATGDYKTTSSNSQMIAYFGWSSLQQKRTEARLVMMYRITHDLILRKCF